MPLCRTMLILRRHHITLRRAREDDLEEIRAGRNSENVRHNHLFQETITEKMQQEWFEKINTPYHYFFVILKNQEKIGLTHVSKITPDLSEAEYGLFIWDKKYLSSRVPLLTTFLVLDFFFTKVGIKKLYGRVLRDNLPIQRICRFFNWYLDDVPDKNYFLTWSSQAMYQEKQKVFVAFFQRLVHEKDEWSLRIKGAISSLNLPKINEVLSCSTNLYPI